MTIATYAPFVMAVLTLCLCHGCSSGTEQTPKKTINLSALQWKHRPLFVFTPSAGDKRYKEQKQYLEENAAGLKDRDMLVFHVVHSGPSHANGDKLNAADEAHLRTKYDIDPENFTIILVGKDGTVKMRRDAPVKMDEIFALIDEMPMRKREMQENRREKEE